MVRDGSHRLEWRDLPAHVREAVEAAVGGTIVHAIGQTGGYGPGLAARCSLEDGRRYFVKAVSPAQNPESPHMMRREAKINASLPPGVPAPALQHVLDDGEWVVLIFEDIEGKIPGTPWTVTDLRSVGNLSRQIGAMKTHDPLPTIGEHYQRMFTGWRTLQTADPAAIDDAWCRRHLPELVRLEDRWTDVVAGEALVHGDFRSDNILISGSRAYAVDWTSTCRGAAWFDLVGMLPSVEVAGGGSPEEILEIFELELDDDAVLPLVAAVAGYFARAGSLPDPPGLPTVREFQRAQGRVTISWLRRLTGWD